MEKSNNIHFSYFQGKIMETYWMSGKKSGAGTAKVPFAAIAQDTLTNVQGNMTMKVVL